MNKLDLAYLQILSETLKGNIDVAQELKEDAESLNEVGYSFSEGYEEKYPFIQEAVETLLGSYDFTRCVRPDGSVYGSRGRCKKGTEAGPAEEEKKTSKKAKAVEASATSKEKTQEEKVAEWYKKREATFDSMKGYTKQQVLKKLNEHQRIHALSVKDSLRDLKQAVVGAIHGNREPGEVSPRQQAAIRARKRKEEEKKKSAETLSAPDKMKRAIEQLQQKMKKSQEKGDSAKTWKFTLAISELQDRLKEAQKPSQPSKKGSSGKGTPEQQMVLKRLYERLDDAVTTKEQARISSSISDLEKKMGVR